MKERDDAEAVAYRDFPFNLDNILRVRTAGGDDLINANPTTGNVSFDIPVNSFFDVFVDGAAALGVRANEIIGSIPTRFGNIFSVGPAGGQPVLSVNPTTGNTDINVPAGASFDILRGGTAAFSIGDTGIQGTAPIEFTDDLSVVLPNGDALVNFDPTIGDARFDLPTGGGFDVLRGGNDALSVGDNGIVGSAPVDLQDDLLVGGPGVDDIFQVRPGAGTALFNTPGGTTFDGPAINSAGGLTVPLVGGAGLNILPDEGINILGPGDVYRFHARGEDGAGFFAGWLTKAGGGFRIDHPLDPGNKYLNHSFVESPDMMNVYNGNIELDANGEAWIDLPDYFDTLNRDFRYQLTCIGGFAPVYVAEEIDGNRFKIAGGTTGMKVSWQVTGVRQDPFAEAHQMQVEEEKVVQDRGRYIHPSLYGVSPQLRVRSPLPPVVRNSDR